ncbi:MAG: PmoA family protein [Planctomycetota bacterium]|nr:PmoA family protein [Planctomycetota bacterium]
MPLTMDVVPEKAVVIRREKRIVAACWYGPWVQRPYVYPFRGPGGCEVTRLGHPEDPIGHSHHRSIWIAHHDVGGVDFWGENRKSGRIVVKDIGERVSPGERVGALLHLSWQDAAGREILQERRRLTFIDLPREELALELDLELRPPPDSPEPVTLGVTPFGMLGVRVARTLRVHDRLGGLIVNSQEGENEADCFAQHAAWCDYSGPVPLAPPAGGDGKKRQDGDSLPAVIVGISCFDHPENG